VALDDGEHILVGADHYVYWEINLGNSDQPATYWLLVDRLENQGYISPVKTAIDKIRTQRLATGAAATVLGAKVNVAVTCVALLQDARAEANTVRLAVQGQRRRVRR